MCVRESVSKQLSVEKMAAYRTNLTYKIGTYVQNLSDVIEMAVPIFLET
jgi:hypothetical protein